MTMKPLYATFSDSRHAVQTTKISLPTKSKLKTGPLNLGILYGLHI